MSSLESCWNLQPGVYMRQIRRPSPASVGKAFHEQDLLETCVCREAGFSSCGQVGDDVCDAGKANSRRARLALRPVTSVKTFTISSHDMYWS